MILPPNFGERPCDRLLERRLNIQTPLATHQLLGYCLMVWKDYALAREDRRIIPLDADSRMKSDTTAIIEGYMAWSGEPGSFVEPAIQSGFFSIAPLDESTGWLVLTDFYPANREESTGVSQQRKAAAQRWERTARNEAVHDTEEQMRLFQSTGHELLKKRTEADLRTAGMLVNQLARCLKFAPPSAKEWKESLVTKACDIRVQYPQAVIDAVFQWCILNRESTEIPPRLDLVLDAFPKLAALVEKQGGTSC